MMFISDAVRSENYCQSASRIIQKIIIHGKPAIIFSLTGYFVPWTHKMVENDHRSLILPREFFS